MSFGPSLRFIGTVTALVLFATTGQPVWLASHAGQPPPPATTANPVPLERAHAHNDYAHARPLLDALECGFCSIEADVHLIDGDLLVAHNRSATRPDRTLSSLYLEPLRRRAAQNGGRVYPDGPVCLLFVDIKTEAESTYTALHELLARYQDIVTRYEGGRVTTNALSVIVSGSRPRSTMTAQSLRYAALDGLANDLDSEVPTTLVPVVSERWGKLFDWRGLGPVPDADLTLLREMVGKAHARGRRIRFWGAPDRPEAWRVLCETGADLINTDKLVALRDFLLGLPEPLAGAIRTTPGFRE